MDGFTVLQQDHPQVAIVHLWNAHPATNSTIRLNRFPQRLVNNPLDPGDREWFRSNV